MESPLADPLTNALFLHHRERASPALVARLMPVPVLGTSKDMSPDVERLKAEHRAKIFFLPTEKVLAEPRTLAEEVGLRRPTMGMVTTAVCKFYRINYQDFIGDARHADLIRARHVSYFLCRHMTGKSLLQIGAYVNRDHTSVLHAIRKIEADLRHQARLRDEVDVLKLHILDFLKAEAA